MYYFNSNVSNLSPGWYTLKVKGVPVVVQGTNVVTKGGVNPTSFNFVQASDGVSFNIYTDGSETYFAEFDASNPPNIYIQQKDTGHPTPRWWSVNKLSNGTYTIGPIGGSPNVWTAPTNNGQLYLADDTINPPTVQQQFTIS